MSSEQRLLAVQSELRGITGTPVKDEAIVTLEVVEAARREMDQREAA